MFLSFRTHLPSSEEKSCVSTTRKHLQLEGFPSSIPLLLAQNSIHIKRFAGNILFQTPCTHSGDKVRFETAFFRATSECARSERPSRQVCAYRVYLCVHLLPVYFRAACCSASVCADRRLCPSRLSGSLVVGNPPAIQVPLCGVRATGKLQPLRLRSPISPDMAN